MGYFVELEDRKSSIKPKSISNGLDIYGLGIVEYSVRVLLDV